jgi:Ca2+-binding RTX toxin-like protein
MFGGNGADSMWGAAGNDTIHGGHGDDRLHGGSGHDDLAGGRGDDFLKGGAGSDTFIFTGLHDGKAETDVVADYHRGQVDALDLPGGAASIASDSQVGGVWQLTLKGDGDIIKLPGVSDENHDGHIIDDLLIL